MKEKTSWQASQAVLLLVVLLGWALALSRLGERSLWADEGATAYQAQKPHPLPSLASMHYDGYSFLHLPLMMIIVRLTHHEMALRLPSAAAAVLALPVVYALGRRLSGRVTGLSAAFLLAISPFAIGYAQEARVYALFELFACLSLLFLLLALARERWFWWAGFVASTALLLYTHFFAWFVVGSEVLCVTVVLTAKSRGSRRLDRRFLWLLASLALVAVSYWPLLRPLLAFWQSYGLDSSTSQHAGLPTFQLSPAFILTTVMTFGPQSHDWRLYLFGASVLLGLASLAMRRRWEALLLVTLWFGLPLAGLTIISSQHFFDYRYLIWMLPLFLVVTAEGMTGVASLLIRGKWRTRFPQAHLIVGFCLTCLLFIPANWPALTRYHRSEKENWLGISFFVSEHLLPDEVISVTPTFWAYPLLFYQPLLEQHFVGIERVDQLQDAAQQHAGVWYLRFAGALADPTGEIADWIAEQQFELLIDAGSCGQGVLVYYRRFDGEAPARQADLLRAAAAFCPTDPRFQP